MSKKSEEAASIAAYGWQSDKEGNMTLEMFPEPFRRGFVKGYEQAEKDLALTWEDIRTIFSLLDETARLLWSQNKKFTDKELCEETLRKFNEAKEER